MKLVIPTVTAKESHAYRSQMDLVASISNFVHVDLSSPAFNRASPLLDFRSAYLEDILDSSVHLMYQQPLDAVQYFLDLTPLPKMIILQVESDSIEVLESIKLIKDSGVLLGLALLQDSKPEEYSSLIKMADQVVIFSGNLGEQTGIADLSLTSKVTELKKIKPELEIAWDGGINKQNIEQLSKAGIDIFYVGGAIHKSTDPAFEVRELQALAESVA